jgi:hypothetical protein
MDESVIKSSTQAREQSGDRFADAIQLFLTSGRRHGLGFCVALESAESLDPWFARKIQSYFVGPIPFMNEPRTIAELLNVSEDLVRPAVNYEDGRFLFTSSESPYHRRVPVPISTTKNTETVHAFLDGVAQEQERRRLEFQAQEEERKKRWEEERRGYEERRRLEEEEKRRTATDEPAMHDAAAPHDEAVVPEPAATPPARGRGKPRGRVDEKRAEQPPAPPAYEPLPVEFDSSLDMRADEPDEEAPEALSAGESDVTLPGEKKAAPRRRRGGKKHQKQDGSHGGDQPRPAPTAKSEPPHSEPPAQEMLTFATSRFGGYEPDEMAGDIVPPAATNDAAPGEQQPRTSDGHKKNSRRRGHRRR